MSWATRRWTTSSPVCGRASKPQKLSARYARSDTPTGQSAATGGMPACSACSAGRTVNSKPPDNGGGSRSIVGRRRSRSGGGVGNASPKPSLRSGSGVAPSCQRVATMSPALRGSAAAPPIVAANATLVSRGAPIYMRALRAKTSAATINSASHRNEPNGYNGGKSGRHRKGA